jgi:uncharacterized protein (DUF2062 family)
MARKFFRRFMPSPERVHSEKALRWLRPIINKPYLWHLNRHSVARGVGWGAFWALIPIPIQSPMACLCAYLSRGNVPLAYAACWISNPFTLIPHWWSAYLIGKFILRSKGLEGLEFNWEYWKDRWHDWHWMLDHFWSFFLPLMVGSVVEALLLGAGLYVLINVGWKRHARTRWLASRAKARRVAEVGAAIN